MGNEYAEIRKFNNGIKREKRHDMIHHNLFLIRELYQIIAIKESYSVQAFYNYLFADDYDSSTENIEKKCRDKFQHLLYDTYNFSKKTEKKLTDCGIAPEFFDTEYIKVSEELEEYIYDYFGTNRSSKPEKNDTDNTEKKDTDNTEKEEIGTLLCEFRSALSLNYEYIYNLDGSPLIYSIRELVNKANNCIYEDKKELYALADKVALFQSPEYYTGKNVGLLYKKLLEQNRSSDLQVTDTSDIPTVNSKNIYPNKQRSEAVSANYFIIRELYKIFAEIEDVGNAMKKFYSYLNISETDYQNIIDTGIADNKALAEKLIPFQFPANMFRGDKPAYISMHKDLEKIIIGYLNGERNDANYQTFLIDFRLQILYINRVEDITLVFPVYNLYYTIKQADSSAEIDYKDFAWKYSKLS